MQWIILIGGENFDLNSIKAVEHYESIQCYDAGNDHECILPIEKFIEVGMPVDWEKC